MSIKNVIVSWAPGVASPPSPPAPPRPVPLQGRQERWKIVLPTMPQRVEAYAAYELQSCSRRFRRGTADRPHRHPARAPRHHPRQHRLALRGGAQGGTADGVREVEGRSGGDAHNGNLISWRTARARCSTRLSLSQGRVWRAGSGPARTAPTCLSSTPSWGTRLAPLSVVHLPRAFAVQPSRASPTEHWWPRRADMGSQNSTSFSTYIRRVNAYDRHQQGHFQEHPDWFAMVDGKRREDGVRMLINPASPRPWSTASSPSRRMPRSSTPSPTMSASVVSGLHQTRGSLLALVRVLQCCSPRSGRSFPTSVPRASPTRSGNVPELPVKGLEYRVLPVRPLLYPQA